MSPLRGLAQWPVTSQALRKQILKSQHCNQRCSEDISSYRFLHVFTLHQNFTSTWMKAVNREYSKTKLWFSMFWPCLCGLSMSWLLSLWHCSRPRTVPDVSALPSPAKAALPAATEGEPDVERFSQLPIEKRTIPAEKWEEEMSKKNRRFVPFGHMDLHCRSRLGQTKEPLLH